MANELSVINDRSLNPLTYMQGQDALVADSLPVGDYLSSPAKRTLDIVVAAAALVCFLPLIVMVCVVIKATSKGGAIFRQRRYGRSKEPFLVYKLRSMRLEPKVAFQQAVKADPRTTRVGAFIRRTSIDELPQLVNVLRGHMSLVGPRPHAIEHDQEFEPKIVGYRIRYLARPGITGLAQISGARGATPTVAHMQRRLDLDSRYIQEASFLLDLKILALTAKHLVIGPIDESVF